MSQSDTESHAGRLAEPRHDIGAALWTSTIHAALTDCALFMGAIVLEQVESTQDAARSMAAQRGAVVVALRQTAGRGRLGRPWADTGLDGAALTAVVARGSPERLAIAAAVGVARAAEDLLGRAVGIKWPNDIVVGAQKLAGILIEQAAGLAFIGVGMNVSQQSWPAALQGRAVSLAQLGACTGRLPAVVRTIRSLDEALRMDDVMLAKHFAARDTLTGTTCVFRSGASEITGRVLRIDPMRGLAVYDGASEHWLPAASATVIEGGYRP